jgi:hypothetical protein
MPTRSGLPKMGDSLRRFRLFGFTSSGESLLLAPIVRARFQFIVLTGIAVEVNDFLRMLGLRHGVWTSGIAVTALAFWTRDAKSIRQFGRFSILLLLLRRCQDSFGCSDGIEIHSDTTADTSC